MAFNGFGVVFKGAFFSESDIRFSNLPISQSPKKTIPKIYPELEI